VATDLFFRSGEEITVDFTKKMSGSMGSPEKSSASGSGRRR